MIIYLDAVLRLPVVLCQPHYKLWPEGQHWQCYTHNNFVSDRIQDHSPVHQESVIFCSPLIDMLQFYTPMEFIDKAEMTNAWIYTEQRNNSEKQWEYCDRVKFNLKVPLETQFSLCLKTIQCLL